MHHLTRRHFLGAAAAGTLAASRNVYGASENRTLKAGVMGCGWYGNVDLDSALAVGGVEAAAICDVDTKHLANSADAIEKKQGTRPKMYKDYREMLSHPGLDFFILAPPTQWHALPFIAACEKGLDIYAEKPFSYDIREGRAMLDVHAKAGNIVQIGLQRRQNAAFNEVKQFIEAGHAGRIIQVDAQIHYHAGMKDATPQDPPSSLDWDTWCGPAPLLPYHPNRGHMNWRLEQTTGHGHLVDWGIHLIDATRYILGLDMPTSVTAAGGLYRHQDKITTPDMLTVHFEFEQCPVVWRHRLWGATEFDPQLNNGIFFYGEKATIFAREQDWTIIPKENSTEHQLMKPKAAVNMAEKHMASFLQAVRTRKQPSCPPIEGHRTTTTVNLGMIAYETGQTVQWDAENEAIPNSPQAHALLKRDYRAPWKHPYNG